MEDGENSVRISVRQATRGGVAVPCHEVLVSINAFLNTKDHFAVLRYEEVMYCGKIMVTGIAARRFAFWLITLIADDVAQSTRVCLAAVYGGALSA